MSLICWKRGVPDNTRTVMLHYTEADAPVVDLCNEVLRHEMLSADRPINIERLLHCGETLRLCRNTRTLHFGLLAGTFFASSERNYGGKRKDFIEAFWWQGVEAGLNNLIKDVERVLTVKLSKVTENREAAAEATQKEYDRMRALLLASLDENTTSSPLGGHYPLDSLPAYRRSFLWGYRQTHRDETFSAARVAELLGCERSVGLRLRRRVWKRLNVEDAGEITNGAI